LDEYNRRMNYRATRGIGPIGPSHSRLPGPLFLNVDRARKGERLTGRSVGRMLAKLGKRLGITVRPHGLQHASITDALDSTNGNIRVVQRFSRHRDLRVLTWYDDNRRDLGGEVARLVAKRVGSGEGNATLHV
jgi:integrase/recombinase XerC